MPLTNYHNHIFTPTCPHCCTCNAMHQAGRPEDVPSPLPAAGSARQPTFPARHGRLVSHSNPLCLRHHAQIQASEAAHGLCDNAVQRSFGGQAPPPSVPLAGAQESDGPVRRRAAARTLPQARRQPPGAQAWRPHGPPSAARQAARGIQGQDASNEGRGFAAAWRRAAAAWRKAGPQRQQGEAQRQPARRMLVQWLGRDAWVWPIASRTATGQRPVLTSRRTAAPRRRPPRLRHRCCPRAAMGC